MIGLFISIRISVLAVALCALPVGIFSLIVNAVPNKKLLDYSLGEQFQDFWPALWMSAVMGGVVYLLGLLQLPKLPLLIIQILVGGGIYLLLSAVTSNQSFLYVKTKAISVVKKAKRSSSFHS